jgi:hypothetical protein
MVGTLRFAYPTVLGTADLKSDALVSMAGELSVPLRVI